MSVADQSRRSEESGAAVTRGSSIRAAAGWHWQWQTWHYLYRPVRRGRRRAECNGSSRTRTKVQEADI